VNIWQGYCGGDVIDAQTVDALKKFKYDTDKGSTTAKIERPDLSWARVLVVDDSPTNLDVAKGILGKYKMQVDCVLNGQDALDRMRLGEPVYNAIFMDHMMPGMDGIETTKLIRKHPSEYAQKIPVIALTANAVAGSEQMFLNEGFQAFVAKPIKVAKLDSVIHKFIVGRNGESVDRRADDRRQPNNDRRQGNNDRRQEEDRRRVEQVVEPPQDSAVLEVPFPAGINKKLGLSLYEDDMDLLKEIMRSFSDNIPTELARMRNLTQDNLADYAIDIHTLKGAGSGIGAKDLSVRAKKMERMAKAGEFDNVAELNEAFISDTETLIKDIKAWLAVN
jgi:CheY-like chemotaxis protein